MFIAQRTLQGDQPLSARLLRVAVWIVALLIGARPVQSQPPTIVGTLPLAVAPGQTVDLVLDGERLHDVTRVWTSFFSRCDSLLQKAEEAGVRLGCRVTVPRDQQVGIAALRVGARQGVSGPKLIMVDDLPSGRKLGDNRSLSTAQDVKLPIAIDGRCDPLHCDYYRFQGAEGQSLAVEVVGQRLGSQLDAVVRLLDEEGRELARCDDEPGVGADARLAHRLPKDGVYAIELRDVQHRGGANFFYRLRLGNFPLLTVAYPLGGRAESVTTFEFLGPHTDGITPQGVALASSALQQRRSLGVTLPRGEGSGFVSVAMGVGAGSEFSEIEPNDQHQRANRIELPCTVNGRFEQTHDRDYFCFAAQKDQTLVFHPQTRDLGSPADLILRLERENGERIAQADDHGANDGILKHTFSNDGDYYLVAENLWRAGSPSHAYRIEIAPRTSTFSLSTETDTLNAPQGGTAVMQVKVQREAYQGPIELSVVGVGDGHSLSGQVIPQDKDETQLAITFPETIAPGEVLPIHVVGQASLGAKNFSTHVSTLPALRKLAPNATAPAELTDGELMVGIGLPFPPFFSVRIEPPTIYFPQVVGATTVRVLADRLASEFKGAIALELTGLPVDFHAEVAPIEQDQTEATIKISGPPDAARALHPLKLTATSTFQNQTKQIVLGESALQVVRPLVVQVEPQGPIRSDDQQTVVVRVRRFTERPEAVTLTWKSAPTGIRGPLHMELAPDQQELRVEISAAKEGTLESAKPLIIEARTMVNDQEVVVESEPVALAIEPRPS